MKITSFNMVSWNYSFVRLMFKQEATGLKVSAKLAIRYNYYKKDRGLTFAMDR